MAGPSKKEKKASVAHAAAKRRSAGVNFTADSEARVREVLEGLALKPEANAVAMKPLGAEHIVEVFERLLAHGFKEHQIRRALQGVAGKDVSEETALDWLCMHVEPAELPKRFAGAARNSAAAAGVKVLARAQDLFWEPRKAAEPAATPEREKQATQDAAVEAERARDQQQAKEKATQRAWIMHYMEQDSPSDTASQKSEGSEIEEWELWGDPREVERRKAERKKAKLPPEARKAQLAEEWVRAKAAAANAKAAADKARQKAAGAVIRGLKLEMQQLGLSEEGVEHRAASTTDAHRIVPAPPAAGEVDGDWPELPAEGSGAAGEGQQQASQSAEPFDHSRPSVAVSAQQGDSNRQSEVEDFDLGGGMFDEDAAEERLAMEPGMAKPPPNPEPAPWGLQPHQGRSAKKKHLKGVKQPWAPEVKAPKAVLQQFCHSEGRAPPKFERLAPGGNRLATAGVRYSVTVDVGPQRGVAKKKAAAKQRCFVLWEDEDGWETIQDAQNAAATAALREVMPDKGIWHYLPKVYQDLWLALEEADARPSADSEAERLSFAEHLAAMTADTDSMQPGLSPGVTEAATSRKAPAKQKVCSQAVAEESQRRLESLRRFRASKEGQQWMEDRKKLPVGRLQEDLLRLMGSNDVVLVCGDTGCGKTTQVPQYLLDASIEEGRGGECSIICTQPRRIAAISVAERVCQERGVSPPGTRGSDVGYHVRLDDAYTRDTKLLFCTTGILLRRLASDNHLASTSHVIVDEVHERTLQGDFLMALLKDIVAARRSSGHPLKVVLMSATLDSSLFARYFGDCPTLAAGGRTFPVDQLFLEDVYEMTQYRLDAEGPAALRRHVDSSKQKALQKASGSRQGLVKAGWGDSEADLGASNPCYDPELYGSYTSDTRKNLARLDENRIDYDLLEDLVTQLAGAPEEGAILVFLPGMGEITSLLERLTAQRGFREGRCWVLPLHSSVSPQEQRKAFDVPPAGVRKIVLATNIAETSLTISDVCFVVDSGKLKERRYDASRSMSLLVEDWISRANALQRKGRAGRVRAGKCFALYTRDRLERRMRPFQAPEMVRVPLDELVLQIQLLRLGPAATFLGRVIEPPPLKSIQAAVAQLQAVKALAADETLTALGHHVAQLPVDARVGKLLLLGASLECLAPVLTMAACLSYKSPFAAPRDQQDAGQRIKTALAAPGSGNIAGGQQSDHLLMAAVFQGWAQARAKGGRQEAAAYARKHMLSQQTLEMIADMRAQFATMLVDSKFIVPPAGQKGSRDPRWIDDPQGPHNREAKQTPLVKAVLCAALYPNVAVMDDSAGKTVRPVWNDGKSEVHIHPSSINHPLQAHRFLRPFLVYLEKVKTSRTFLRDCSVASPVSLLLFGGELEVKHAEGYVLIDGWIRVRAAAPTAVLVKELRRAIDALLGQKIRQPELSLHEKGAGLVDTLVKLLNDEEAAQHWNV